MLIREPERARDTPDGEFGHTGTPSIAIRHIADRGSSEPPCANPPVPQWPEQATLQQIDIGLSLISFGGLTLDTRGPG